MEGVIELAKSKGFMGVAVWRLGKKKYLAGAMTNDATLHEIRAWEESETGEDALAALALLLHLLPDVD